MNNRPLSFILVATTLLTFGWICGGDPIASETGDSVVTADDLARQELAEIKLIREKLRGSVLNGSLLDSPKSTDFDAKLQSQILSSATNIAASALGSEPIAKSDSITDESVIAVLRKQSSRLDVVANHIESLREYESADSLRESAKELRELARRLDSPIGKAVYQDGNKD